MFLFCLAAVCHPCLSVKASRCPSHQALDCPSHPSPSCPTDPRSTVAPPQTYCVVEVEVQAPTRQPRRLEMESVAIGGFLGPDAGLGVVWGRRPHLYCRATRHPRPPMFSCAPHRSAAHAIQWLRLSATRGAGVGHQAPHTHTHTRLHAHRQCAMRLAQTGFGFGLVLAPWLLGVGAGGGEARVVLRAAAEKGLWHCFISSLLCSVWLCDRPCLAEVLLWFGIRLAPRRASLASR